MKGYAGIMLGLRARALTGRGRQVEVSEMEALAALHSSPSYRTSTTASFASEQALGLRPGGAPAAIP